MTTSRHRLYADHCLVYLADGDLFGYADDPPSSYISGMWTRAAFHDRYAEREGAVGLRTGSYGFVEVEIQILGVRAEVRLEDWDHVTEGNLQIETGIVQLVNCIGSEAARIAVDATHYRVRCCHANLAAASDSGGNCGDWYRVELWPGSPGPIQILKRTR